MCASMVGSLQAPVQAVELAGNAQWIWVAGIIAHDRGPTSDRHEDGIDLNLEVQFAPLNNLGSPRPHLGVTANFEGDTSVAYGGLNFVSAKHRNSLSTVFSTISACTVCGLTDSRLLRRIGQKKRRGKSRRFSFV